MAVPSPVGDVNIASPISTLVLNTLTLKLSAFFFLSYVSFISAYSIPIIIIIIIIIITIIIIISLCKKTLQQRCIDFDFQLCRAQATQWGWEGKGRIGLDQLPCLLVPQPMKDRHTSGGRGKDPEGSHYPRFLQPQGFIYRPTGSDK